MAERAGGKFGDVVVGVVPFVALLAGLVFVIDDASGAAALATSFLALPLLHLRPAERSRHGSRALGWATLLPMHVVMAIVACDAGLTSDWRWRERAGGLAVCGMFLLPAWSVMGSRAMGRVLASLERREWAMPVMRTSAIAALALLPVVGFVGLVTPGQDALELLRSEIVTVARLPSPAELTTPILIDGIEVRVEPRDGVEVYVVDDHAASFGRAIGDWELARGLGFVVLRRVGSEPRTWLAYRPRALEGPIHRHDLGARIDGPRGAGRLLLFGLALALFYSVLGERASRRAARIASGVDARVVETGLLQLHGRLVPCDPSLPIGSAIALDVRDRKGAYRTAASPTASAISGDRAWLLAETRRDASEHFAVALSVAMLAVSCGLVTLLKGLALAW